MSESIERLQPMENSISYKIRSICRNRCTESMPCLCDVLNPLIRLCQIFGVFPISHNRVTCRMTHKWVSLPAFISFGWLFLNIIGIFLGARLFSNFFQQLNGTDFYSFGFMLTTEFVCTISVFMFGNCNAHCFSEAWESLHQVNKEIPFLNFRKLKTFLCWCPLYLILELVIHIIVVTVGATFNADMDEPGWLLEFRVVIPLVSVLSNAIPNLVAGNFSILIWIASKHFKLVNEDLRNLRNIGDPHNWEKKRDLSVELEKYYNLHETLCEFVRILQKAFGLQILAVFLVTAVSFVVGVYGIIAGTQGMVGESSTLNTMGITFGITYTLAAGRMLVVILCCQHLLNEAGQTADILKTFDLRNYSEDTKIEIDRFLNKLGNFKLRVRCCNILNLDNTLLGSAASNLVTYVLILLQFRVNNPNNNGVDNFRNISSPPM